MRLSDLPNIALDFRSCGVHKREEAWPFLYSVLPAGPRGIVVNVQPEPPKSDKPEPLTLVRDPVTNRLRRPKVDPETVVIKVKAKKAPAPEKKGKPKPFDGAGEALADIAAQWTGGAPDLD